MEYQQGKVHIIEIEDNSSIPSPVIKSPVTPRRRKTSVLHLEKFEDNALKRPVVSAISIPLSPKKLSSDKDQEDKQTYLQEQAKKNIEIGSSNDSQSKNYLFKSISSLKPIEIIFKAIKLIFFLILFASAGIFTKDVIQQFQAKDTFIGQSLKNITKLPTIVVCLETEYIWEFGSTEADNIIAIDYGISVSPADVTYITLEKNTPHQLKDKNETVFLEQINENCFKVNSTVGSTFNKGLRRQLIIEIAPGLSKDEYPPSADVYFTSEENHYGITYQEWFEGQVLKYTIPLGSWINVNLKPVEYRYQNHDFQCSSETFLQQWMKGSFLDADLSNCTRRCAPVPFLESKALSIHSCPWEHTYSEYRDCVWYALFDTIGTQKMESKRPCHVLEYQGDVSHFAKNMGNYFILLYTFSHPEMTLDHKENLLFDEYGLVVYVGGILGMSVGFTFIGMVTSVLDYIQSKLMTYF